MALPKSPHLHIGGLPSGISAGRDDALPRSQRRTEEPMKRLLTGLCVACLTVAPALAQGAAQSMPPAPSAPDAATQSPRLVGTLRNEEAWRAYKLKFVSEPGRVLDTANG